MSAAAPTVLARILGETRVALEQRKRLAPLDLDGLAAAAPAPGRLVAALSGPEMAVIAEFKRRSPSAGTFREDPDLLATVTAYERGGAAAASVLTEEANFGGSLDDLRAARAACGLVLLRKDFVVDEHQLGEASLAGADAVLLIVAALDDGQLSGLHRRAGELGLDVLVEVHDEQELERALALEPRLIGVNNRDLRDFSVDLGRTERLLERMPAGVSVVSESGISEHAQLERLQGLGVAAVLVGETLMRAGEPEQALRRLRGLA